MTSFRAKQSREGTVPELLNELCSLYAGKNGDKLNRLYALTSSVLRSNSIPCVLPDALRLTETIQKSMSRQAREGDALLFVELNGKLSNQRIIQRPAALLTFLQTLMADSGFGLRDYSLPNEVPLLTASQSHLLPMPSDSVTLVGSSGIGSMASGELSSLHSHSRHTQSNHDLFGGTPHPQSSSTPFTVPHTMGRPREAWSATPLDRYSVTRPVGSDQDVQLSESVLVRDLIFVFQNIEGEHIHYDSKEDAFRLDKKVCVSPSVRELTHKLAELGWLHRKIKQFIDSKLRDKTQGLVCQSFCSALALELTEYYRLIAVLEAQQRTGSQALTLRRLLVWTYDPMDRLKWLAVLVDGCKRLKGGALISALYAYSQHGDVNVNTLIKHLLNQVYQPINSILNSWIFDGELMDKSLEFFISCDDSSKLEKLWRSKYNLRQSMLPSFISKELAQKILIIGKSINFLRQSCEDHTQLGAASLRNWYLDEQGQCSFDTMTGPGLQAVVNSAYKETSKYLLKTLHNSYNFMEHLKALRRYLLLGQGDFIRHLMDLLTPELLKPASSLYLHNLTGTLETAVRATNAQFETTDILNRLDVRMLDLSPGDQGWDVFSLHYHVTGPISTVFTADAMLKYLRMFNFLWRGKRMEYCLANMWRNQTSNHRTLSTIKELRSVLHQFNLLLSAMVHFISQLQYYITFEVMECCWAALVKRVEAAVDLDQVIDAHNQFLEKVTTQCLLDAQSQPIQTRVRAIFDVIVNLQQKQDAMYTVCLEEVNRRALRRQQMEKRTEGGQWGTVESEERVEVERQRVFVEEKVSSFRAEISVYRETFKDLIKEFLGKLTSHPEQSLQFLCFRLDFNEYYSSLANDL